MVPNKTYLSTLVFSIFFFFSVSLSNPDVTALLSFKASSDFSSSLASWANSSDPCSGSWLGVTCNPRTRRVTRLVLQNLDLTGPTLPLTQLTHLRLLSLKHNRLSSSSLDLSSWPNLRHLYLSYNRFSGIFPTGISLLRRLRRLDLSNNRFSGRIPINELTKLPHLLTLRLENNSFTETLDSVPSSLSSSILDFNVSNNNLSGQIPAWMSRFRASSFTGNKNLCGVPLRNVCSNRTVEGESVRPTASDYHGTKRVSDAVVLMIVSIDTVAIVAALVTITCCCYRRKCCGGTDRAAERKSGTHNPGGWYFVGPKEDEEMVVFEGCKGFNKVGDLLKSSAELLGKGSVGNTYKVVMDSGDVVVVKRVRERRKRKEVDGWLTVIGGLGHRNIVSLRAYYDSKDELLLVYDFLPNGSLHSLLQGNRGPGRTPLDWTTRLKLAAGSAQGLAFLHCYNKVKLFHGHLTSSNILVDRLGNACISDTGLHQLLRTPSSSNSTAYRAPEVVPNNSNNNGSQRKFTQKCDVYSFGVILLEILTGKVVTGEGGETGLVKWVQSVGREEWLWEVFDIELLREKKMEEEMEALLQVALLCLAPLPKDRPKMSMVHRMIEDIGTKGARDGMTNSILNHLSSDSSPSLSESTPQLY